LYIFHFSAVSTLVVPPQLNEWQFLNINILQRIVAKRWSSGWVFNIKFLQINS